MVQTLFFYIFSILGFTILLYIGMKLSKHKIKSMKILGYFLMVIGTLGLILDFYNLIHRYINVG